METDTNNQSAQNDFTDTLPDEMKSLNLRVSETSSRVKELRPKLQATKSLPPYNQCIGGLGQDTEPDDTEAEPSHCDVKNERKFRRRESFGGNCQKCRDECEKINCTRGQTESQQGNVNEVQRDTNTRLMDRSGMERPSRSKNEQVDGTGEMSPQWPSPHPILSKLMHSSSSSSCSSICASSGESDEVFSEGESDVLRRESRKKCVLTSAQQMTFKQLEEPDIIWIKRSRSWKTFLTMMHWTLKRQSSWVQLAGHQGNFHLSEEGEVLKLYSEGEASCLKTLMKDHLRPFIPQYYGLVTRGEHCYIRLEDLLSGLRRPVIMDCKMGVRTYQEEEICKAQSKPLLRNDMYQKMVRVDPSALSAEEHAQKGVTKWRYLHWRDTKSSTSTLGFRIEGIMMEDGNIQRDFRNISNLAQVTETLLFFTKKQLNVLKAYHSRLTALGEALKNSQFFKKHEVIGSSLLFVHDRSCKASVWMIDFGKTVPLPDVTELKHDVPWTKGSREDGYLLGLTSLITSLNQAIHLAS